jgi:hypothetical protein
MATVSTIELAALKSRLDADSQQAHSSLLGVALLLFALVDILASLFGYGLILPAVYAVLPEGWRTAAPWLAAPLHALPIFLGYQALPPTGLSTAEAPEAALYRTLSRGGQLTPLAILWAGIAILAFLLLMIALSSVPLPASRASGVTMVFATIACPIALAAVLTRGWHAMRFLKDPSILIGAALGFGAAVLAALAVEPVVIPPASGPSLALTGALLLSAVPVAFFAALQPRQRQVYHVTVHRPMDADLQVPHYPFDHHARTPSYLSFLPSEGQLLVLIRRRDAAHWELFDAGDSQRRVALHDYEMRIFNLTRLSAQLAATPVVVRNSSGDFELSVEIGRLTVTARMRPGRTLDARAVEAASNILFQNQDLSGLLHRSLEIAFNRYLGNISTGGLSPAQRIEEVEQAVEQTPTAASILSRPGLKPEQHLVDLLDTLGLSAGTLRDATEAAERHQQRLVQSRRTLREVLRQSNEVQPNGGLNPPLLQVWHRSLGNMIDGAGGAADQFESQVDTSGARRMLELIGMAFSNPSVTLVGAAATLEERITAAQAQLAQLIDQLLAAHREVLARRDQIESEEFRHLVRQGSARRRVQEMLIANRAAKLGSTARPAELPGPPPALPTPAQAPPAEDGIDEDDDGSLN